MAKINIGAAHDSSKVSVKAELSVESVMELNVGDGFDMSQREIQIIEREKGQLAGALSTLRQQAEDLRSAAASTPAAAEVVTQATAIADAADRMTEDRKWYSVSSKGLLEAAEAVGAAASPIVATAMKVLDLLQKVRAQA